jgi:chromosome segregation ATPase
MFEAHSAHTSALSAELQLYRNLAQRLQAEVGERDGILAKLNLRVIEGEMMRAKVDELESELKRAQREQSAKMTHRSSASPLTRVQEAPATPEHVGNRTTVAQAANRDLEIRLAKALADQEALTKELEELKSTQGKWSVEVNEVRATLRSVEEREREAAVSAQRSERELQQQLEVATRREQALSARLAETQMRAEEAEQLCKQAEEGLQKVGQLEKQVKELKEVKLADEEELARLSTELSGARTAGGRSEEDRSRIAELERIIEEEREIRRELESDITQERHEREDEHRAELDGLEQRLEEMAAMRDEFELEMQAERDARAEVEHELEEVSSSIPLLGLQLICRLARHSRRQRQICWPG